MCFNLYLEFYQGDLLCISDQWGSHIEIPRNFSEHTNAAIKSGMLTSRARDEVVNHLACQIMRYTMYLSTEDLKLCCSRLVQLYPACKDTVGSGYVSSGLDVL